MTDSGFAVGWHAEVLVSAAGSCLKALFVNSISSAHMHQDRAWGADHHVTC